jgi:transposase
MKKVSGVDVRSTIQITEKILEENKDISSELRVATTDLLIITKALFERANRNSENSSSPPSEDRDKNPKDKPTDKDDEKKNPGGQPGHKGNTLLMTDNPDVVIKHVVLKCNGCGVDIFNTPVSSILKRQVIDITIKKNIIEHQVEVKLCQCGSENCALFPEDVSKKVQYGPVIKATVNYLSQHHLIPYGRLSEIFNDLFNIPISAGTFFNFNLAAYENLKNFEDRVKRGLVDTPILHVDETGINVKKIMYWIHVAASTTSVFLFFHKKRGQEAMNAAGILPIFKGIAVHDFWKSYFSYSCKHALCGAHLVRELTGIVENSQHNWAALMKKLLLDACKEVSSSLNRIVTIQRANFFLKYFKDCC